MRRAIDEAALLFAAFLIFCCALLFGLTIAPWWAWRQAADAVHDAKRDALGRPAGAGTIGRDILAGPRRTP